MRLWLEVPYSQKDRAKSKGARWDPNEKRWYAPSRNLFENDLKSWHPYAIDPTTKIKGINRKPEPVSRKSILEVELVPRTCWFSNVRSNISKRDWDIIRKDYYSRSEYRCQICSGRGLKHPVELHEVWEYDDTQLIQKLQDMIVLCPACHEVKHIGLAGIRGRDSVAQKWLCRVNDWTNDQALEHIAKAFEVWESRSDFQWELDIKFLEKYPNLEFRNDRRELQKNKQDILESGTENEDYPYKEGRVGSLVIGNNLPADLSEKKIVRRTYKLAVIIIFITTICYLLIALLSN